MMFLWNLRYLIYFRTESSAEDAAYWMLRVPLLRAVWYISGKPLGIRWDGVQTCTGIGMGATDIAPTLSDTLMTQTIEIDIH